jgi:hypothetical protein
MKLANVPVGQIGTEAPQRVGPIGIKLLASPLKWCKCNKQTDFKILWRMIDLRNPASVFKS